MQMFLIWKLTHEGSVIFRQQYFLGFAELPVNFMEKLFLNRYGSLFFLLNNFSEIIQHVPICNPCFISSDILRAYIYILRAHQQGLLQLSSEPAYFIVVICTAAKHTRYKRIWERYIFRCISRSIQISRRTIYGEGVAIEK